jgi:hypothetical protein
VTRGVPWLVVAALGIGCSGADPASSSSTSTTSGDGAETGVAASGTAAGSTGGAPGPGVSLVTIDAWTLEDPAADPWSDRPADAACEAGYGPEDGVFEVDTEVCAYGTFVQPSLVDVAAGDTLELILIHDALWSEDEGAVAHIAVAIGGVPAWETSIEIPALSDLVRPTFEAPLDAPAGSDVHVHVHNHGYNNYRVFDLTVR